MPPVSCEDVHGPLGHTNETDCTFGANVVLSVKLHCPALKVRVNVFPSNGVHAPESENVACSVVGRLLIGWQLQFWHLETGVQGQHPVHDVLPALLTVFQFPNGHCGGHGRSSQSRNFL